jgi:hypothetical protein
MLKASVFSTKIVGKLSHAMSNPTIRKMVLVKDSYFQNVEQNKTNAQYLIRNKDKQIFCSSDDSEVKRLYLNNYQEIKDKKLITISPGGYRGFYMLGVCSFIKENYNTKGFIFSGASAGAWNSLFMTFKYDPIDLSLRLLNEDLHLEKNIKDAQRAMKEFFLNNYVSEDFDLTSLFIGVTTISNAKFQTNIFSDFNDLEDAINCCIASSNIPLITGSFDNKYNNQMVFDGGFSRYPYLNIKDSVFHVSPNMWGKKYEKDFLGGYTRLFLKSKYGYIELYDDGYADAKKNKEFLDKIFLTSPKIIQSTQDL